MVDFGTAIRKPFSNMGAFVIAIILGAIPIVNILVGGFVLKVAEDTMKGKKELRSWAVGDIVDYIVKVIIAAVIGIVYLIIPVIILVVGVGAALITALPQLVSMSSTGTVESAQLISTITTSLMVGAPLIIVGVILAIIAVILLPMAILKWLKSGKIGAAFKIGSVVKNVLTGKYWVAAIVGVVYAIIVSAILGAISLAIGLIPILGWIIALLIISAASFMSNVAMYSMLAQTVD